MWWWPTACESPDPDPTLGWSGGVTSAPAPLPGRMAGPPRPGDDPRAVPLETLRHRLCQGLGEARSALLGAVAATPPAERGAFVPVVTLVGCDAPDWCAFVTRTLDAAPPAERSVWLAGLWSCDDEASTRRILAEAPEPLLRAFVESTVTTRLDAPALPWTDRFDALTAAAAREEVFPEALFRAVARIPDPAARQVLAARHREADGFRRLQIGASLDGSLDRASAALAESSCTALGRYDCVGTAVLADLPVAVERGLDPVGLVVRYPNHVGALREGLVACVAHPDAFVARRCAVALAQVDPDAARAAIAAASTDLRDVLVLPAAEARADLRDCGFALVDGDAPAQATWTSLLAASGAALHLDAVSSDDTGPGLLYRLSVLAGLDGAEFDTLDGPEARAFLGWSDGVRYRTVSRSGAVGWEAAPSVRLVNAMLAARDRPERLVPDESYTNYVLGTPAALGCAAARGLVRFAEAPLEPTGGGAL